MSIQNELGIYSGYLTYLRNIFNFEATASTVVYNYECHSNRILNPFIGCCRLWWDLVVIYNTHRRP